VECFRQYHRKFWSCISKIKLEKEIFWNLEKTIYFKIY
jgi:hypothetical protein